MRFHSNGNPPSYQPEGTDIMTGKYIPKEGVLDDPTNNLLIDVIFHEGPRWYADNIDHVRNVILPAIEQTFWDLLRSGQDDVGDGPSDEEAGDDAADEVIDDNEDNVDVEEGGNNEEVEDNEAEENSNELDDEDLIDLNELFLINGSKSDYRYFARKMGTK